MPKSPLADAFAHHVWATILLIDVCAGLDSERLATTVPGTYGSILDTLRHTVAADRGYLSLLSDGRLAEVEESEESELDLAALRSVMEEDGQVWAEVIARDIDPEVV